MSVLAGGETNKPRRKSSTSPTQRTLAELKRQGYQCAIVEKWMPQTRRRVDAFGFIDLIALRPGEILAVQATSGSNDAARVAKILSEPRALVWLAAGGLIQVWGWRKLAKPVGRKQWLPKITDVTEADFPARASAFGVPRDGGDGRLF